MKWSALVISVALAGCTLGPDYRRPAVPVPEVWRHARWLQFGPAMTVPIFNAGRNRANLALTEATPVQVTRTPTSRNRNLLACAAVATHLGHRDRQRQPDQREPLGP